MTNMCLYGRFDNSYKGQYVLALMEFLILQFERTNSLFVTWLLIARKIPLAGSQFPKPDVLYFNSV